VNKSEQRRRFINRSISRAAPTINDDAVSIYDENYWQRQAEQLMADKKSNLKDIHELRQQVT